MSWESRLPARPQPATQAKPDPPRHLLSQHSRKCRTGYSMFMFVMRFFTPVAKVLMHWDNMTRCSGLRWEVREAVNDAAALWWVNNIWRHEEMMSCPRLSASESRLTLPRPASRSFILLLLLFLLFLPLLLLLLLTVVVFIESIIAFLVVVYELILP